MTKPTPSTWFITGASSGIGFALARAAAERGDNVVAVARTVTALQDLAAEHRPRILAIAGDVRRQQDVEDAVSRAVSAFHRIDVVANNAGYGVFGAVEEVSDEQARGIFDTNVFGLLNVMRATLPVLRAQGGGHLLQGSSYFGRVAHPGVGLLSATKYAVEGLTEALFDEVEPLGITVTLVEPGPTATPFGGNFVVAETTLTAYDASVRGAKDDGSDVPAGDDPDRVAAAILEAVDADRPPRRLVTGSTAFREVRDSLKAQLAELDAWASTSKAVDRQPVG